MKEQHTFHIDTTPEEDNLFKDTTNEPVQPKTLKRGAFTKIFCAVFGIHVLGAGVVSLCASSTNATLTQEPKKLPEQAPVAQSSPTPEPTPVSQIVQQPNKPVAAKVAPKKEVNTKPEVAKVYVVKKGDTICAIAKKYKLSTKRLLQINGIKDTNKIKVGQSLKFM
jgi:LysM repeat protein